MVCVWSNGLLPFRNRAKYLSESMSLDCGRGMFSWMKLGHSDIYAILVSTLMKSLQILQFQFQIFVIDNVLLVCLEVFLF